MLYMLTTTTGEYNYPVRKYGVMTLAAYHKLNDYCMIFGLRSRYIITPVLDC